MSYLGLPDQVGGRRRTSGLERIISSAPHVLPDPLASRRDAAPREAAARSNAITSPVSRLGVLAGEHAFSVAQAGVALLLLIFILPLMIMLAIAICAEDGGSPVFRHRRVGRGGQYFNCWKFRTMCVDAERRLVDLLAADPDARREWAADQKLRNDPRITGLGRFLRKSSLDELPQLINILRGEMNLVGPRPIVEAEIPRYGWRFKHYMAVKPGVTGLWQISGRNEASYRTRVALDSMYAKRRNVLLDGWIVLCTVPVVLCTRGSY